MEIPFLRGWCGSAADFTRRGDVANGAEQVALMRLVGGEAVVGRGPTDGAGLLFLGQLDRDVGREEIDDVSLPLNLQVQIDLVQDFLARGVDDLDHLLRPHMPIVRQDRVELADMQYRT